MEVIFNDDDDDDYDDEDSTNNNKNNDIIEGAIPNRTTDWLHYKLWWQWKWW